MKVVLAHIALLVLAAGSAVSQDSVVTVPRPARIDSLPVVDTVVLVGNAHTKDFVILREMSLGPGVRITPQLLEYDKNRIYSLRLFNEVRMDTVPSAPGRVTVVVTVKERWYIFPYPVFGIKDRDWSKVFYGFGISHQNFRGRNEKLFTTFVFGYDPAAVLYYRNPFLSTDGTYALDTRLAFNKIQNKSIIAQDGMPNFDERHYSIGVSLGRRFGIAHALWVSAGYEVVEIPGDMSGTTISPDGRDNYPTGAIGYSYDTRDLTEYPTLGTLAQLSISQSGVRGDYVHLTRYAADLRQYIPLVGGFVLAGRGFTNVVAGGKTPSYNHTYFGYAERIRGHFKEVMEGEDILGFAAELHYELLTPRYFKVGFLPEEFSIWKFGIVAALFGDAGTVWFRGDPVALNRFAKGYGAGLNFLLPYSAVLQVDYAFNEARRGEFILDVGRSF